MFHNKSCGIRVRSMCAAHKNVPKNAHLCNIKTDGYGAPGGKTNEESDLPYVDGFTSQRNDED